jgi:hypothetical protein
VPCSQPHTTVTIYVGRLDTVVDGHALAVDSERAQRQQARVCPQQLARFLGGSPSRRRLSRFAVVWFSPTIAQGGQGADWFRCDVVAFGGDDTLAQLPSYRLLHDVLDQPSALDRYGLCGTAAPGAAGFSRVVCGRSHSWQAVATLPLSGGRRYPGTATVRQAGDQPCQDIVHGRDPSALTYRYGWEWPTREQWDGGQHYGFCWAPDAG